MVDELNFNKEIEDVFSGSIYKRIGLKEDPFVIDPKNKIDLFVDRDDPFNKLLRGIRNMLEGFQAHIGILGSHGIGKSHFGEVCFEIIDNNKHKIGVSKVFYVKGKQGFLDNFLKMGYENSHIIKYRREHPKEKILVFFDDLDVIFKRHPKEFMYLFDILSYCIIGTWDTYAWNNIKLNNDFKIPKTDAIYLDRLKSEHSEELLKKRLNSVKLNNKTNKVFPDFVISALASISEGNPYSLITYAKRYLDFVFENNILEIDQNGFNMFCDSINVKLISDIKKEIIELTDKQKDILKFIIEYSEVSAQEISNKFNMTRVAGMHNLKKLKDLRLLESKTKNRTDFYYVPTDLTFEISDYLEKIKENNIRGENEKIQQK